MSRARGFSLVEVMMATVLLAAGLALAFTALRNTTRATGAAEARYVATRFRALGGNRFVAEGSLTLRGVTQPVPLQFTWTPGAKPVLEGSATLKRLAFKVGEGDWADTALLPDEVKVSTRLVLSPR